VRVSVVKSKVVRLDPQGFRRVLDVCGPSGQKNKTETDEEKQIYKYTKLAEEAKCTLQSLVSMESDSSLSEYSD
jgi:hypothetical protein